MKDTAFQIHTTEENKRWLEDRAADLDCSLSEYVHELIQKHIDIVSDDKEYPYDDSERLQTIVDDVYDETDILLREFWGETASETAVEYQPGRLHLLVLWRLVAGEYSNEERQFAMRLAQDYIGEDLNLVPNGPQTGEKWRDTTATGEVHPARYRSRSTGSDRTQLADKQDTDSDTDETLGQAQFMADGTGGDADE